MPVSADAAPGAGAVPLFSDLLLHEMGDSLGDGIPAAEATGNEFRTAPLWGVRASKPYLHDGRAETLEEAMRKIDKETRTRFEDTFNRINAGLQDKFPKLFGGGHAYLELVGEDPLAAGVAVMARPPGKRNSSIHQLSGGEKALTAVALVFSIFDLNPAPFCLLDEVDAPLDEHNVGRFCDIVRQMSERVQFIFITHNKATMELASQLLGGTMTEPGCSRLVAVDVDEAVRMATA